MLNRLFTSKAEVKDGLTQAQREAIVDVLHYCMYADKLITISENQFVAAKVKSFSWDPKISFEYYQGKSIGAVRLALDNKDARERFFASLKQRLATPELRKQAFELCQKLFMADGNKSEGESASQAVIRQGLGL